MKISPKSTVSAAKLVGLAPKLVPYEEEDEEEHMVESNKSNGVREEFPLKKSADTTGGWESIPLTKEIKIAQPTNFIPPILLKKQQIKVVAKRSEKFDNTVENEVIKDEKKEEKPDSTSFVKPIDGEKPRNRTYRERKWSSGDSSISSNDKERKSRKKERRSRSPVASDKHIDHDYHQRHKSISSHRHPSSTTDESDSRRSDKKRKFTPSDESDGSSDGRHHHRKKEKRRKREEDEERREVKEKDKKKKKKKKRREEKEVQNGSWLLISRWNFLITLEKREKSIAIKSFTS